MAHSATASQGLELVGYVMPHQVLWVPGDPGDTFTKGDCVTFTLGEGIADPAAADEPCYGVVAETVVCTSSTSVGFPRFNTGGSIGWGQVQDSSTKTLVPIYPIMPVGTPIFRCSISDQYDDENITSFSSLTMTVGTQAQDDANGAIVYIYGGLGAGQWSVVADVGASNDMILHRAFDITPDATSDVIVLAGEAADNRGVGFFGRVTMKSAALLDVSDGANNGEWTVFLDARDTASFCHKLQLPVVPSGAFLMA